MSKAKQTNKPKTFKELEDGQTVLLWNGAEMTEIKVRNVHTKERFIGRSVIFQLCWAIKDGDSEENKKEADKEHSASSLDVGTWIHNGVYVGLERNPFIDYLKGVEKSKIDQSIYNIVLLERLRTTEK